MKIAVNKCFGGFGLSTSAIKRYLEMKNEPCFFYKQEYAPSEDIIFIYKKITIEEADKEIVVACTKKDLGDEIIIRADTEDDDVDIYSFMYEINPIYDNRSDEILIKVIEELGSKANGKFSKIEIVDIPDDIEWCISDYDGIETIHEKHRSW